MTNQKSVRAAKIYTGKRKEAIAQAFIRPGQGRILINGVPLEILQPEISRQRIITAIILAKDIAKKYNIEVNLRGGGYMGQAEATSIAISRALVGQSKSKRLPRLFKDYERVFLAGDPRRTESKKFGGSGPRRRKQKSYR